MSLVRPTNYAKHVLMTLAEPPGLDTVLVPFLQSPDDEVATRRLDELLQRHALPSMRAAARRHFLIAGSGTGALQTEPERDAEDLCGDATVQLIARLQQCRQCPEEQPISNFRAYATATVEHAWSGYLRRKYPERSRIHNKLRYVLTHQPGLALWQDEQRVWLAGFAKWQPAARAADMGRLAQICQSPQRAASAILPGFDPPAVHPARYLEAVFRWLGGPAPLNALTTATAILWSANEPAAVSASDVSHESVIERSADPGTDIPTLLAQRTYLERLLEEIEALPIRQRHALLLNFCDSQGRGLIALFPLTGAASIRRLSDILTVDPKNFAALWNALPLDDNQIAERLGLTRQQVINLRRVARDRLARRVRSFDNEAQP